MSTYFFLIAILSLPIAGVIALANMINFNGDSYLLAVLWLGGFGILALNNSHMLVCSVVALWPNKRQIPEMKFSLGSCNDLLYIVKNENTDLLFATMSRSFAGNVNVNSRLWLLSNSDDLGVQLSERMLILRLQERFGTEAVNLFQARRNPLRRKHICIHEWLEAHPESRYMLICDADTVFPSGTVEKLVRKAEHSANAGIALFQSHIRIVDEQTRFARMLSYGQEIAQRLYTTAHQRVLGRSAYYGSGCLIRAEAYRRLNVPAWVLSHDIWETVGLELNAGRIVYCGDVVTFGRFPHNMLDLLQRSRRWIFGTMESLPLLVVPGIPFGTRFLVLLPIYFYLSQLLLLVWIGIGFAFDSSMAKFMSVQTFMLAGSGFVHLEMNTCLAFTMAIVFGHRFTQCRTFEGVGNTALELFASSVLCLNCILFDSLAVIEAIVRRRRGREWVPAVKVNRPLKLSEVAYKLWPTTLFGVTASAVGLVYSFNWAMMASPFLISFGLGIPAAYWTSQKGYGTHSEKAHSGKLGI